MSIVQEGVNGHSWLIMPEYLKLESCSSVLMPWWVSKRFWVGLADRSIMVFFYLMRLNGGVQEMLSKLGMRLDWNVLKANLISSVVYGVNHF